MTRTGTPRVGRIDRLSQMKQRRLLAHEVTLVTPDEFHFFLLEFQIGFKVCVFDLQVLCL